MLHEFITANREEIIRRCRAKVATRSGPPPTRAEIDHGVPMFLDQLVDELRLGLPSNPDIRRTATQHGKDLRRQGFTVSQAVHDYGDVCQAVTEMAVELDAPISTDEFRMLNQCLDDAIASAVTQYGREHDEAMDEEPSSESERHRLLAELRNSIQTVGVALEAIKSGSVGIAGSTGKVLSLSLLAANNLVDRLFGEADAPRTIDAVTVRKRV